MTDSDQPRDVVILGSTGSIGTNCLDVIDHLPGRGISLSIAKLTYFFIGKAAGKKHTAEDDH